MDTPEQRRADFRAILAVEGLELTPDEEALLAAMEAEGLSAEAQIERARRLFAHRVAAE